jgi:DNA-binding MarR family transcriptional regulator
MASKAHPEIDGDLAAEVRDAAQSLVVAWGRAHEALDERISPSQLRALLVLADRPGICLSELASALGAIASSASRLCSRLEAAGWVERLQNPTNGREVQLVLTDYGGNLLRQLRSLQVEEIGKVLARMPAARRRALLMGLDAFRLADAIDDLPNRHVI